MKGGVRIYMQTLTNLFLLELVKNVKTCIFKSPYRLRNIHLLISKKLHMVQNRFTLWSKKEKVKKVPYSALQGR